MWFHVFLQEALHIQSIQVKAKPVVKQGRKANGSWSESRVALGKGSPAFFVWQTWLQGGASWKDGLYILWSFFHPFFYTIALSSGVACAKNTGQDEAKQQMSNKTGKSVNWLMKDAQIPICRSVWAFAAYRLSAPENRAPENFMR